MRLLGMNFGKKAKKTQSDIKRKEASGFFSTHSQMDIPSAAAFIEHNMFRAQPPKPVTEAGVAMDSAYSASQEMSIKGAYQGGQVGVIGENLFAWYVSQGFIGFQACAIIAQHWLVDKACTVAPQDAVRKGYELTVNDGNDVPIEALERLKKIDVEHNINKQLVEFAKFNRVFGIRIAVFHVESEDPEYYEKPFNIDGVVRGSYKGFSQIDPYWITPELDTEAASETGSRHFYEPTWWRISGKRYHRSHLVVIRTTDVSDILKPSYIYGGIPLPQRIYERVYAAERTANEAPLLALTKRTTVLKTDTEAALGDQEAFEEKLATWIYYRDNQGVKVCGTDEELQQIDTSLTDLDAVIMTQYQIVASIANTPATKLLGTAVKGFNATGEFDESIYHEYLETIQTGELTPLLKRHHELSIRSDMELGEYGDFSVDVQWKPLDSLTEIELADVQLKNAQTATALQLTGAIDGTDIRNKLIADKFSGYNGLETEEDQTSIKPDEFEDEMAAGERTVLPASGKEPANLSSVQVNKQQDALNGAQITSMVAIVQAVAAGTLPRNSGVAMLMAAFTIDETKADSIMGDAGQGFKIAATTSELPAEPQTHA